MSETTKQKIEGLGTVERRSYAWFLLGPRCRLVSQLNVASLKLLQPKFMQK